jgi:arylsulfatase A
MSLPNALFILADDLGYGDGGGNNPESRIPTPHLDRLAAAGMRFTNAHASAAQCSPTRYSIMTGRYPWRSRLKTAVLKHIDTPLKRFFFSDATL